MLDLFARESPEGFIVYHHDRRKTTASEASHILYGEFAIGCCFLFLYAQVFLYCGGYSFSTVNMAGCSVANTDNVFSARREPELGKKCRNPIYLRERD
jgi:hypothetical protein